MMHLISISSGKELWHNKCLVPSVLLQYFLHTSRILVLSYIFVIVSIYIDLHVLSPHFSILDVNGGNAHVSTFDFRICET